MLKARLLAAAVIGLLPLNSLRVLGYRMLGYEIRGRIGFGTIIAVSSARIDRCRIGVCNLFIGPMKLEVGVDAVIGNRNVFWCGPWTTQEQFRNAGYGRHLSIGPNTLITSAHYFDIAGSFELGEGTWIGGVASQFWTHGAGVAERDIRIGRNCYLGSAIRIAPGAALNDNTLVAMGSVVTKRFKVSNAMIGGVPAEVLKENYDWRNRPAS